MVPADVVHVGVDTVRCRLGQQLPDRPVVVVERHVESELPVSRVTFAGVPALPTTRPAPSSRAMRPTAVPTPPAAAETKRSCPARNSRVRVSAT
ncbi:hypothetical protein SMICM17S_05447 [Streptomyces microflavus]